MYVHTYNTFREARPGGCDVPVSLAQLGDPAKVCDKGSKNDAERKVTFIMDDMVM
jgi:hypothetical protein